VGDLACTDRFAEGLPKAGLLGKPGGHYKFPEENRLAGDGIRDLVSGRTLVFPLGSSRDVLRLNCAQNGEFTSGDEGESGGLRTLTYCATNLIVVLKVIRYAGPSFGIPMQGKESTA
jgi:hypothetical protein